MIVYKITNNKNEKVYVGSTNYSLENRMIRHKSVDKKGTKKSKLYLAFKEIGFENFKAETIENCSTKEEMAAKEIYWIGKFNSIENGYNTNLITARNSFKKDIFSMEIETGIIRKYSTSEEKQNLNKSKISDAANGNRFSHDEKFWSFENNDKIWSEKKEAFENRTKGKWNAIKIKNLTTGEIFESLVAASKKYKIRGSNDLKIACKEKKECKGCLWQLIEVKRLSEIAERKE